MHGVLTRKVGCVGVPSGRGRGRAAVAEAEPEEEVRLVDGVEVVKDEPLQSPLSTVVGQPVFFNTYRLLTLADGTQRHACADCPDVVGTRGEIRTHRVEMHGARPGGAKKRADDGGNGGLSANAASMTLGELVRLAGHVDAWEDAYASMEERMTEAEGRATAAETELRKYHRAFDRLGFKPKLDDE